MTRFNIFPYREEEPRPGRPAIARPTVNLILANYQLTVVIRALVDTGSPFCIFGRAVADAIDIDMGIGRGPDREIHILGGVHRARVAHVEFDLPPFEGLSWETEAYFLYADLNLSFAGVLGQQGFLDRWVASFNYYDGYFVIEQREAFIERLGRDPAEDFQGRLDSEWDRPTKH